MSQPSHPLFPRVLRPRRAAPADAVRPTRAEINLHALRHNLGVVRKHAAGADVWASDCPLASIQIQQALGRRPMHPIQVLERAYRADGFLNPVESKPE